MLDDELKRKKLTYLWWALIAFSLVALMAVFRKPFAEENTKKIVGEISNCFFVPGVVMSGIGALSYLSAKGAYDSFGYIFSNFSLHSIIYRDQPKKYESLYDYKMKKDEKGRKWFKHMLVVGLCTLSVSILVFVVYAIL